MSRARLCRAAVGPRGPRAGCAVGQVRRARLSARRVAAYDLGVRGGELPGELHASRAPTGSEQASRRPRRGARERGRRCRPLVSHLPINGTRRTAGLDAAPSGARWHARGGSPLHRHSRGALAHPLPAGPTLRRSHGGAHRGRGGGPAPGLTSRLERPSGAERHRASKPNLHVVRWLLCLGYPVVPLCQPTPGSRITGAIASN